MVFRNVLAQIFSLGAAVEVAVEFWSQSWNKKLDWLEMKIGSGWLWKWNKMERMKVAVDQCMRMFVQTMSGYESESDENAFSFLQCLDNFNHPVWIYDKWN